MKVSVITPCFNHGKYIGEMLDSVMNQSYQDFEVIIVNDGSTDDTAQILNTIANERVTIYHTTNHGPAVARNFAIHQAKGSIILNLDADDMIAPTFLEKCVNIFHNQPNTGIVYGDCEFFGATTGPFLLPAYSFETMLRANCIVANACFLKSDWLKTEGYSTAMTYGYEDFDFWLSIIELGREVFQIKEPLVYYRTYENPEESRSGRRKQDPLKVQKAIIQAFQRHKKLYSSIAPLYEQFAELEKKIYPALPA